MTALFWALSGVAAAATGYWLSAPLRKSENIATADKRAASLVVMVVPLAALGIYLWLGNPNMADAPLAPRLAGNLEDLPSGAVLARLENELRQRPDDAKGWRLLSRLYATTGNHPKAADGWQRLLQLSGPDMEAHLGLATALIEQDDGVVSTAAVDLLDRVLADEADNLAALFWRAEAWAQQGDDAKAKALWQRLRARLDDNMPLAKMLDRRLSPPTP